MYKRTIRQSGQRSQLRRGLRGRLAHLPNPSRTPAFQRLSSDPEKRLERVEPREAKGVILRRQGPPATATADAQKRGASCGSWPGCTISMKIEMIKAGRCRPKNLGEIGLLVTHVPRQQTSSIRTTCESVRMRERSSALTETSDDTGLAGTDTVCCVSTDATRCTAPSEV